MDDVKVMFTWQARMKVTIFCLSIQWSLPSMARLASTHQL